MPLLPPTIAALQHRLAREQAEGRAPAIVAGVVRDGTLTWSDGRGTTGLEGSGRADDLGFRIGSITKTFTAALIMQLRDEGRLALTDTVEQHLPGTAVGDRTIAALLAHTAGLAAETTPPWWERTDGTPRSLGDVLGERATVSREGEAYHYSNTGFGVLGEIVGALTGTSWRAALQEHLLQPLGMRRTTLRPEVPHARGLAVHPWADLVLPEPEHDAGVLAPAGQLWSTLTDLATWARVLAGERPDVLAADTAAEMRGLAAVGDDPHGWNGGHGLGLQLLMDPAGSRAGKSPRRLAGHTGSMPGFVATLWVSPDDRLAAVAMANATSGPKISRLVADLIDLVAVAEPRLPETWAPRSDADPRLLAVAGPWYWGPTPFAVRILAGRELEIVALRGGGRESRFLPTGTDDVWTGREGYYRRETLEVLRDADGVPTHLDLGSFVFTREPYDPSAPVPGGGVGPEGWTAAT
ncbi:serine hydrolase domain-containing protein [Jatrophihabitans sp. YIM 134969]